MSEEVTKIILELSIFVGGSFYWTNCMVETDLDKLSNAVHEEECSTVKSLSKSTSQNLASGIYPETSELQHYSQLRVNFFKRNMAGKKERNFYSCHFVK